MQTWDVLDKGSILNNPFVGYKDDVKFWNAILRALIS